MPERVALPVRLADATSNTRVSATPCIETGADCRARMNKHLFGGQLQATPRCVGVVHSTKRRIDGVTVSRTFQSIDLNKNGIQLLTCLRCCALC